LRAGKAGSDVITVSYTIDVNNFFTVQVKSKYKDTTIEQNVATNKLNLTEE